MISHLGFKLANTRWLCLLTMLTFCAQGGFGMNLEWKSTTTDGGTLQANGQAVLEVSPSRAARAGAVPFRVSLAGDALLLSATLPQQGRGWGAVLNLTHGIENARHLWMPHLCPEPGYVAGDHSFRSPALIFANDSTVLALIPDLDDLDALQKAGLRAWLDYDHPSRAITLAVGGYEKGDIHVSYRPVEIDYASQAVRLRVHVLVSDKQEDRENPFGMAARELWRRWGHPNHAKGGAQLAPLAKYCDYITRWSFTPEPNGWGDTVWQSFFIDGRKCGAPAFIVDVAQHPSVPMDQRKWREPRAVWNQTWFSTQRCANGLLRHARLIKSNDLEERAKLMTQFALAAPQTDGLFPAVYTTGSGWYKLYQDTPGWDQGRWRNSDRLPRGVSDQACHLVDAAFTARLLLEWNDIEKNGEIIPYVARFADRLLKLQRPSGAYPGWVEPDGTVPATLAEGPESAMSAALLLELAQRLPSDPRAAPWKESAKQALAYLEQGPIAQSRWEDFETYFSCSRWGTPGQKVERNGLYKQNTFSPFWCAEAMLDAYRVCGDRRYLDLGRRCLDELSLFQQVWHPAYIPAETLGGFGVMNMDGEWNDARQSLFAPLYLEYYRETGLPEYFERGIDALKSSFAMLYCPENAGVKAAYERTHPMFGPESYGFMMENIFHGGPGGDYIGPFTIFTWGNGAALASAGKILDMYGDVYVDVLRQQAFGIDGCKASVEWSSVKVEDQYRRPPQRVVETNRKHRPGAH